MYTETRDNHSADSVNTFTRIVSNKFRRRDVTDQRGAEVSAVVHQVTKCFREAQSERSGWKTRGSTVQVQMF